MLKNNLLILFFSFFLNFLFIKILFNQAKKINLIDYNKRKKQHISIPAISGLAIFVTFLCLSIYFYNELTISLLNKKEVYIYFFSIAAIFLIGLFDDQSEISTFKKIIFQLIIIVIFIYYMQFYEKSMFLNINNYLFNFIIQIFFVLGIINSINLIDGVDDLAAVLSIFFSISFVFFGEMININIGPIFYIIIGCLLACIVYNNFISRVFLGDSGSLFLGSMFAFYSLLFAKHSNDYSLHIPLMILAVPAFDMIFVMINRFVRSNDLQIFNNIKNIFKPDYSHIHYSMQQKGFSKNKICVILCFLSVLFLFLAVMIFLNIKYLIFRTIVLVFVLSIFISFRYKIS